MLTLSFGYVLSEIFFWILEMYGPESEANDYEIADNVNEIQSNYM